MRSVTSTTSWTMLLLLLLLSSTILLSQATIMIATATEEEKEQTMMTAFAPQFLAWAQAHGKVYDSHNETMHRMKVYLENDERIQAHNNHPDRPTFTLGHNAFSDMTAAEFAAYFHLHSYAQPHHDTDTVDTMNVAHNANHVEAVMVADNVQSTSTSLLQEQRRLGQILVEDRLDHNRISYVDEKDRMGNGEDEEEHDDEDEDSSSILELPDYVNWVELGGVTPVKNQGPCGSCWAFSTTGALEGAKFVQTGELVALSEQNLIDCDHVDLGCSGGLMDNAFKFDEKSGGLCSELDYPYQAKQSKCNRNCTDVAGTIVETFVDVPAGKEKALLRALAMQPVSVAIEASHFVFQFYKRGVITDSACGKTGSVDHGVLAVGYGTDLDSQEPYFLIKNSWGTQWGDQGFVKLSRNTHNKWGMCAILKVASFPVVK